MSKRMDKRSYADVLSGSRGKSIFCGIYMFLCFLFASASPLLKTSPGSTDSDNKDINKTDFKSCNSGFGLPPRFKPF